MGRDEFGEVNVPKHTLYKIHIKILPTRSRAVRDQNNSSQPDSYSFSEMLNNLWREAEAGLFIWLLWLHLENN